MIAIVLVTETGTGQDLFDILKRFGTLRRDSPTRMTAELGQRWLMLNQTDTVAAEYEPQDMERICERLRLPEFYVLQANEPNLISDFIIMISNRNDILIDNDHGWIDSLNSYKQAIAQGDDWLQQSGPR